MSISSTSRPSVCSEENDTMSPKVRRCASLPSLPWGQWCCKGHPAYPPRRPSRRPAALERLRTLAGNLWGPTWACSRCKHWNSCRVMNHACSCAEGPCNQAVERLAKVLPTAEGLDNLEHSDSRDSLHAASFANKWVDGSIPRPLLLLKLSEPPWQGISHSAATVALRPPGHAPTVPSHSQSSLALLSNHLPYTPFKDM